MVGNGDLTKQSIDLNISIAAVYNYMKENVESAWERLTFTQYAEICRKILREEPTG
jgi:hypothetical protein